MADEAQIGLQAGVQIGADGKVRRQPSRGMYILPSLFTAGNMAAGYYAITQSIQGSVADQSYFDRAALALGIAVLFDGLDGIIARMTNTASDFGRELDSLADVITFGVAPSLLAYIWGFRMLSALEHPQLREQLVHIGIFFCFIFLSGCAGWRGFNISINPQPRNPGPAGRNTLFECPFLQAPGWSAR
jgi:CDP-diacylglycerol--serine O-phosphatidyltransferase